MTWRLAALLFGATLLTRLPFLTSHLWAHDSVLYEQAIAHFDPVDQRPQPPGYLWYVLLVRLVALATGDANRAMTITSAVAAAAAVALVFVLGRTLFDRRTGLVAALFLATAVTFWGESEVAYPYTLLAALTTGCAILLWSAPLWVASIAWGVAIGFRTDLALFLAPLWLLAAARASWRDRAIGAVAAFVPGAVWLGATAALSGGFARMLGGFGAQAGFIDARYSFAQSGLRAVAQNAYELARYLGRGVLLLGIPVTAALLVPRARATLTADRRRAAFLALWVLAPLPVYLLIHIGEYGYVFSMLPGLAIVGARGALGLASFDRSGFAFPSVATAVALGNAALFLLSGVPLSARDLASHDQGIDERLAALHELDPACVLVVSAYDRLVVARYVGDRYFVLGYDPAESPSLERPVATMLPRCRSTYVVALWDDLLRTGNGSWATATMPHGALLRSATPAPSALLRIRDGLTVDVAP